MGLGASFAKSTKQAQKLIGNIDTSIGDLQKQKLEVKGVQQLTRYGLGAQKQLDKLTTQLKINKIDANQLTKESKRLHSTLTDLRRIRFQNFKFNKAKEELKGLRSQAMATAASLASIVTVYKSASNTLKAQGEIKTLGISTEGIDAITKSGHEMAMQFGSITGPDFIRASYDIKSGIASLSDDGVNHFTKLAATTAIATKSTTAEMTKLYALGHGIFSKDFASDEEFGEKFSGAIASTVKMFRTDGSDLAQGLSTIGSSAASMGVSLSEQLSIIGVAKSSFNTASEAATGYRNFLDNVGKAQDKLKIKLTDGNGKLLAMPQILEKLKSKFNNLEDISQSDQLKEAFGSAEAVKFIKGLIDKTDELTDSQIELENHMTGGSSLAQTMADAAKQGHGLERLRNSFAYLSFTIGKSLEPIFNALASVTSGIAKFVAMVDQKFPIVSGVFASLSALAVSVFTGYKAWQIATVALKVAHIGMAKELSSFRLATKLASFNAKSMAKAFTLAGMKANLLAIKTKIATAGQWALNFAMSANPIGLVVAGIVTGVTVLVAAVAFLYHKCAPVKAFFDGMWQGFKEGIAPAISELKSAFTALQPAFTAIGTAISGVIGWFGELFPSFKTTSEELEGIVSTGSSIGVVIGKVFGLALGVVSSFCIELKTAFSDGIMGVGKLIINWSPLGLFYKAFSGVMGWLGVDMPNTLTGFGSKMIDGLVNGVSSMFASVMGVFSNLWASIKTAFDGGIAGVSKLIINWSPLGLFYKAFSGVLSWFGVELPDTFTGFGSKIIDNLIGGIKSLLPDIGSVLSSIPMPKWLKSKL